MQEHIKRLAVEFGDASVDAKGRTEYAFDNHVITAFAQAVARECADICDKRAVELGTRWSGADVSPDASSCAALIRARFGLEG